MQDFDWKSFVFKDTDNFDERVLYREKRLSKDYSCICIKYSKFIDVRHYKTILRRYFGVYGEDFDDILIKMKKDLVFYSKFFSSSIVDSLILEMNNYLVENNIRNDFISKKEEQDVI